MTTPRTVVLDARAYAALYMTATAAENEDDPRLLLEHDQVEAENGYTNFVLRTFDGTPVVVVRETLVDYGSAGKRLATEIN